MISPAFFGRSVRSRHMTKAEARRKREDAARQQQKADFLASGTVSFARGVEGTIAINPTTKRGVSLLVLCFYA